MQQAPKITDQVQGCRLDLMIPTTAIDSSYIPGAMQGQYRQENGGSEKLSQEPRDTQQVGLTSTISGGCWTPT